MRRLALILVVWTLAAHLCRAAEEKWVQIHSPNFVVATNAGEKRGREIALRFEQMRRVFVSFIPREKLNLSTPLQIVAFRSNRELKQVAPLYKGKPVEVAGLYFGGPETNYIALDASGEAGWSPVFHEYAHLLLNTNYPRTPAWFDEGFAEYYSTVRVDKKNYYVGEPPESTVRLLFNERHMPLEQLLAVEHHSEDYNKTSTRRHMFYAQSWLLVHYIFDSKKLPQAGEYFSLVRNQNISIVEAVQRAFGMSLKELEKDLHAYMRSNRLLYYKLPIPGGQEEVTYVPRKLKPHEAALLVADLHLQSQDHQTRAEEEYKQIIAQEPYFADAHRGLGYLYFRRGDVESAQKSLRRAADLDSKDPRVYYLVALALLQRANGVNDPELLVEASQNLDKTIKLDPAFAEAYDLKGQAIARASNSAEAITLIKKAVQLEPRNERFQFNLASQYTNARKFDEAIVILERLKKSEDENMAARAAEQVASIERFRDNPLAQLASEPADKYTSPEWRRKPNTNDDDKELDELEQAQTGNTPDPPDPRKVKFAKGVLMLADCRPEGGAWLVLRVGTRQLRLRAANTAKIVMIGADQFECGWKNKRVAVNYRENSPTEGELMSLEVSSR